MKTPLLDVHSLHLSFSSSHGSIDALRGVNFRLYPGEIVGLIGESGSGKSLTAFSILKLLPPSSHRLSGKILFEGRDLLNLSEKDMQSIRGQKIGLIFQDPALALNPTKRIGDQLIEGLVHHQHLNRQAALQIGLEWLKKVGISDSSHRMRQYPHELSGGMKQRIVIAMTLACRPSLIIADEPTTALDVTIQAQILELLKELQKEHKMTVLLITHDLGVAASCCERLMVMYAGQIVESNTLRELFRAPQHPYTQALLKAKQSLAESQGQPLFTLPGSPSLNTALKGCAFGPRCCYAMRICQEMAPPLHDHIHPHVACWLPLRKER